MCVCGSTRPGVTTLPSRSHTRPAPPAGTSDARPTKATLPPVTPIAPSGTSPYGVSPSIVATTAFVSKRSNIPGAPTVPYPRGRLCCLYYRLFGRFVPCPATPLAQQSYLAENGDRKSVV